MKGKNLTTNQGVPISDNQNSLTVGERGPVLLQDVQFIEKMAHFDRKDDSLVRRKEAKRRTLQARKEYNRTLGA